MYLLDKHIRSIILYCFNIHGYKKATSHIPFYNLVGDVLIKIVSYLKMPWLWTFQYAMTGIPPEWRFHDTERDNILEITKYGVDIVEYFYSKNFLNGRGKVSIAEAGIYHGNLSLLEWSYTKFNYKVTKLLYMAAIEGNKPKMIDYLFEHKIPYYKHQLIDKAIWMGNLEILKKLEGYGIKIRNKFSNLNIILRYAQFDIFMYYWGDTFHTLNDEMITKYLEIFVSSDSYMIDIPKDKSVNIMKNYNDGFDPDAYIKHFIKFLEYFKQNNILIDPSNLIKFATTPYVIYTLMELGGILTDDLIEKYTKPTVYMENMTNFWLYVINNANLSIESYKHILRNALSNGNMIIIEKLYEKGITWDENCRYDVINLNKEIINFLLNTHFPFNNAHINLDDIENLIYMYKEFYNRNMSVKVTRDIIKILKFQKQNILLEDDMVYIMRQEVDMSDESFIYLFMTRNFKMLSPYFSFHQQEFEALYSATETVIVNSFALMAKYRKLKYTSNLQLNKILENINKKILEKRSYLNYYNYIKVNIFPDPVFSRQERRFYTEIIQPKVITNPVVIKYGNDDTIIDSGTLDIYYFEICKGYQNTPFLLSNYCNLIPNNKNILV